MSEKKRTVADLEWVKHPEKRNPPKVYLDSWEDCDPTAPPPTKEEFAAEFPELAAAFDRMLEKLNKK